jgi:signal transduction histidine kinase
MGRRGALRIVVVMRGWRADLVVAAVALFVAAFIAWQSPPEVAPPVLSIAVMSLVRRFPRVVLAVQAVLAVIGGGYKPPSAIISMALMLVALAVVALRYGPLVVAVHWAMSYAAMLGVLAVNTSKTEVGPILLGMTSFAGLSLAPVVLGRYVRGLRSAASLAKERAAEAEQRRTMETHATRLSERTRLARDLHDVMAHNVGAMTLRASSARLALDSGADRAIAAAALSDVAATGRRVLDELRVLLGILREPDSAGGDALLTDPDAAMAEAVARVRTAGVPVEVTVDAGLADASPLARATVARVVQEALTNVLKHAGPGTPSRVTVSVSPSGLRAEVSNDRPVIPAPGVTANVLPPSGHGLAGMRERVELLGGVLAAGPTPDHGWSVTVDLPTRGAS